MLSINKVEIFDISGRNLGDLAKTKLEINISHLPKGVYLIKVKTADSSLVRIIIKQ